MLPLLPLPAASAPSASTATYRNFSPAQKPTEPVDSSKPVETRAAAAGEPSHLAGSHRPRLHQFPRTDSLLPRGNLLVVIKAREDSWLSISVDGEIVTRALLTAPAQKSIRADKEIVIKAGNIGALDFEFNGQKFPRKETTEKLKR